MPEFLNPFSGVIPQRRLSKSELVRAIRLDLAAELEATHLYLAHADAADDPLARKVLVDIANEERVHAGEFARLLAILTGDEDGWLQQGAREVDDMRASLAEGDDPQGSGLTAQSTVGSLIDQTSKTEKEGS